MIFYPSWIKKAVGCMCVHLCTSVHIHTNARGQHDFLHHSLAYYLVHSLPLKLQLTGLLDWLASEPQKLSYLSWGGNHRCLLPCWSWYWGSDSKSLAASSLLSYLRGTVFSFFICQLISVSSLYRWVVWTGTKWLCFTVLTALRGNLKCV